MPIATTDPLIPMSRRSGEEPSSGSGTVSASTLMVESVDGYDFPELEGKDLQQQRDALISSLEVENRIKDGAENLLELHPKDLQETLRKHVESALQTAKKKIEAITKKLEEVRGFNSSRGLRKKPVGQSVKTGASYSSGKRKLTAIPIRKSKEDLTDKDDFRTAMTLATTQVARLVVHARVRRQTSRTSSEMGVQALSSISPATLSTDEDDVDHSRIEAMTTLVSIFKRNTRVRYEIDVAELVAAIIPCLADGSSKESRTAAFRLLRYALVDIDAVEKFHELDLDWYIVRSLARDNKHHLEKEQAILFIRSLVDIGNSVLERRAGAGCGKVSVSEPVMRALVAIAEHTDDPFRGISLVTLAEILLVDIELMYRTGGIRVLIQAISDGPQDLGPLFVTAFLFIVDAPRTRAYLRPDIDLESALSGITDAYGKGEEHAEKMKACAKIVQVMLRTWSGLMYLCMNDMMAIRAAIDTLRIPSLDTREIILDMFFDLLNIKAPEWYQAFISGRRLTLYGRPKATLARPTAIEVPLKQSEKLNLTDQYIGLLLLVLVKAGLLDALISMLEESTTDPGLARKATLLVGEILQIANKVLPLSVASKIQALPKLFDLASDYKHGPNRIVGTTALSSIDSFNRNRTRLQPGALNNSRQRANSVEDPVRRGQRQVEQTKIKLGMLIDDRTFQNYLIETQVTLTKDQTKWNIEILTDLIEGPLLNPKRLEEAIKVSKWGKRLMTFFHPFSHRFSDLPRDKFNTRWVRLGCSFLVTLIGNTDGQRFLADDVFLRQIVDCFAQLDPFNGNPSSDPIFSKRRMKETLTYGYLEMLGVLSRYPEGVELLERFNIFTAFYHLSELRSRDDLVKGIIQAIDYSIDGHARIVLSKALASRYTDVRLYATEYVGQLIQHSPRASSWTLRLLLTQLYDPAPEVCELAVHILEEACESADILELAVEMQPTLDHLGEIGDPLLLKFMSTAVGFQYLYKADYIEREMNTWFHERNYHYVVQVEVYLAKAFSANGLDDDDDMLAFEGTAPPHFYGAMAKTEMGCQVLAEKGHFAEFAHFIRQHGLESEDFDLILKLKSVLWAVGNIGSTERGLPFMEDEELIPTITDIARESPILSVRGTCFFVLGLISSTALGAEVLDDYGWEATTSPLGKPTGFTIPTNVEEFVAVPSWSPPPARDGLEDRIPPPTNALERDALTAIYNLGNNVIANAASRTLVRLKARPETKSVFSSIPLLYRALHTISSQRYRLPVRRYILELFDIRLDSDTVRALSEYGESISSQPASNRRERGGERPLTMIRTIKRSDADEEDELDIDEGQDRAKNQLDDWEVTSVRAKPIHRFVGFHA